MKKLFITKFDSYKSGGASRFFTTLYPFLSQKYELVFDLNEKNIDIALLNAASTPFEDILSLIYNNPNIVLLNRLDDKTKKVVPINELCHGTIFQSNFCKEQYSDILKCSDFRVIYNGSIYNKKNPKIINNKLKIIHSSWSTFERKNLNTLFNFLKDIEHIEDVEIYTLGNYLEKDKFRHEYYSLGQDFYDANKNLFPYKNVNYLGFLNPENMMSVLSSMDYMYFPSINDACPNTVIESLCCGIPLLYHNSGGTSELIFNAGIQINNKTSIEILNEAKLRKEELKNKAIERGKFFDFSGTQKNYVNYVEESYSKYYKNKKPRIGWILCGNSNVGSSRLGGFNIHESFLKKNIPSFILHYNENFSLDIDISSEELIKKIDELQINVIVFQKVCSGKILDIVKHCKKRNIKIVYSVGDLWETEMYNLSDLTIMSSPKFVYDMREKYINSNFVYIEDGIEIISDFKKHNKKDKDIKIGWFGNWTKMKDLNFLYDLLLPKDRLITFSNSKEAYYCMGHGCEKPWDPCFMANKFLEEIDIAVLPINTEDPKNLYKSANRLTLLLYLGIPTILTPIPSYDQLNLEDNINCFLADFNDLKKWKEHIENFRNMSLEQRNMMSLRARNLVEKRYSLEKVAEHYYAQILKII